MRITRRSLFKAAAAAAAPLVFAPRFAHAQTAGTGSVRHLIYVRLASGFRFNAAFNGDVDGQFNPFGQGRRGPNTQWGATSLLESSTWLDGDLGKPRVQLGMKKVSDLTDSICVFPCIDHEPFSGRADGNHGTGLERFLTGYVGGSTGFLTYVNWGLRVQVAQALSEGKILLPAFSLGEAGIATGAGDFAGYRAPVLADTSFDKFGFDVESALPPWAQKVAANVDERMRLRLHTALRGQVESFQLSRAATKQYDKIFNDPLLKIADNGTDVVDGISNKDLGTIFGTTDPAGSRAALAVRLFHFGCPAVFINQGGYDLHSGEDQQLPPKMDELNRLISGLHLVLHKMQHPAGGSYWDHTLVVFGSEFGRTTSGNRFNSAGGSDHSSDYATRWMSMPMMGGIVDQAGKGGAQIGQTATNDLRPLGSVFSYRSMLKLLLDLLGCDHSMVFPNERPIQELFS